jgi:hypothetical protein
MISTTHRKNEFSDQSTLKLRIGKGVVMMKEKREEENKIAPGLNTHEELEKKASEEEIARGDYTEVTTLSYDEVDPSE